MSLERRLDRIQEALSNASHDLCCDMTGEQLAGIITGSPTAKASDLSDAQLKAILARQGRSIL